MAIAIMTNGNIRKKPKRSSFVPRSFGASIGAAR
jgi:hypothetical protein